MEIRELRLNWHEAELPRDWGTAVAIIRSLDHGENQHLVYCFQGTHNAYPIRTTLYIGRTHRGKNRPEESALGHFFNESSKSLWGVYRDLSLHIAEIDFREADKEKELGTIERLLIIAHKPPSNSKDVDVVPNPGEEQALILNLNFKGVLLPVVYGGYHAIQQKME